MEPLTFAIVAVIATLAYAVVGFFKSAGENIDEKKFYATVLYGIIVGTIIVVTKTQLTEENILLALSTYVGILTLLEGLFKGIYRRYLKPAKETE